MHSNILHEKGWLNRYTWQGNVIDLRDLVRLPPCVDSLKSLLVQPGVGTHPVPAVGEATPLCPAERGRTAKLFRGEFLRKAKKRSMTIQFTYHRKAVTAPNPLSQFHSINLKISLRQFSNYTLNLFGVLAYGL